MPGGATYGAAADFNKFGESEIKWITVEQLKERLELADGDDPSWRPLVVLDVREPQDYARGTVPGARNFAQGGLFINWQSMKPQIDEVVAAAQHSDLVLFANTGGVTGPAASRDLYVLNFLHEVGHVPVANMLRLEGGLNAWREAGYEVVTPAAPAAPSSLGAMLETAGLAHLSAPLAGQSLDSLVKVLADGGRTGLLDELKRLDLPLGDRQKVANAVAKAARTEATLTTHGKGK